MKSNSNHDKNMEKMGLLGHVSGNKVVLVVVWVIRTMSGSKAHLGDVVEGFGEGGTLF